MKKLTTILIAFIITLSVNAQSSWGVTGGKLFNNYYSADKLLSSNSTISSFNLGVYYTKPITSKLNLEWSLLYENKTTQISSPTTQFVSGTYPATDKEFKYRYISLDILSYRPISSDNKLRFGVGAYMSYVISDIVVTTNNSLNFSSRFNTPKSRNYDVGALFALDYKVNYKFKAFVKCNIGLANLMEDTYTGPSEIRTFHRQEYFDTHAAHKINNETQYYRNLGLTIGVKYELSKHKRNPRRLINPDF